MTGLEKIIEQIYLDADLTSEKILSDADSQSSKIIDEANSKAALIIEKAYRDSEIIYKDIIVRAESAAILEKSKTILSAEQSIINYFLEDTLNSLKTLPTEEYFELIYKLISKYSEDKSGKIAFSEKDSDRLPSCFSKRLKDFAKGELILSDKCVDIDSGFVLIYGGVEVNCSFNALFKEHTDTITDVLSNLLFRRRVYEK